MPLNLHGVEHLYIHVPFCKSRCVYCDFYVQLEKHGGIPAYLEALIREIHARYSVLSEESLSVPLQTLYFGGGTPSLLTALEVGTILKEIQAFQTFSPTAEITFELNPDDLTSPLEAYLALGINRFSVGVQSFNNEELKKLSRRHHAQTAQQRIVDLAEIMGDSANISVDLMYGIPTQTFVTWQASVKIACDLPIQHISMYGLQLEAGTALETLSTKAPKQYPLPTEEEHVLFYEWAVDYLAQQGFQRYEASNFARKGFESRHNLAYWQQKNVLAFGPSAHGYVHPTRYSIANDLKAYTAFSHLAEITEESNVSAVEAFENLLIFGLRLTQAGVQTSSLKEACPSSALWKKVEALLAQKMEQGQIQKKHDAYVLHPAWIARMNTVLCDFVGLYI
jgi:oxygen-independent coproporphyrinogen-3 oxidase